MVWFEEEPRRRDWSCAGCRLQASAGVTGRQTDRQIQSEIVKRNGSLRLSGICLEGTYEERSEGTEFRIRIRVRGCFIVNLAYSANSSTARGMAREKRPLENNKDGMPEEKRKRPELARSESIRPS